MFMIVLCIFDFDQLWENKHLKSCQSSHAQLWTWKHLLFIYYRVHIGPILASRWTFSEELSFASENLPNWMNNDDDIVVVMMMIMSLFIITSSSLSQHHYHQKSDDRRKNHKISCINGHRLKNLPISLSKWHPPFENWSHLRLFNHHLLSIALW